jgi:hypothetical protein
MEGSMNSLEKIARRGWIIPVIMAAVFGLAATGVLAATGSLQTVGHTATGVSAAPPAANYSFQLFESDNVTILATPIAWGSVVIGTPSTKTIRVKNTGNQAYSVVVDVSGVPAGWNMTATPIAGLAPGTTAPLTLTLATTSAGAVAFDTNIKAEY